MIALGGTINSSSLFCFKNSLKVEKNKAASLDMHNKKSKEKRLAQYEQQLQEANRELNFSKVNQRQAILV